MTATNANEIKRLVDEGGWKAVRNHAELGPIWAKQLSADRRYTDKFIDR